MTVDKSRLETIADEALAKFVEETKQAPTILERELSQYIVEEIRKTKEPLEKIKQIATVESEIQAYAQLLAACAYSPNISVRGNDGKEIIGYTHIATPHWMNKGLFDRRETAQETKEEIMLHNLNWKGFVHDTQLFFVRRSTFKIMPANHYSMHLKPVYDNEQDGYVEEGKIYEITQKGRTALEEYRQHNNRKTMKENINVVV